MVWRVIWGLMGDKMIKQTLIILLLGLSAYSEWLNDIPSFAVGYGSSTYKSPVLYARKDYFNSIVELNKDTLNNQSLNKCIDKLGGNNETLITELKAEIEYLKKQNEVLLNKCVN